MKKLTEELKARYREAFLNHEISMLDLIDARRKAEGAEDEEAVAFYNELLDQLEEASKEGPIRLIG